MSLIPRAEAPRRTAAMRKPKAPAANRAGIVAAAIDEFAARGFKGASMDAIAVLEQVYGEIREAEGGLDLDHLAPVEALRRIVEFTYNYYVEHEGFVRLVVAENQARGRHLRKSKMMRTLNRPIIERLARVIERGQAQGRFRRDVDPVEVHKAIAALGMFNVTNQ